MFSAFGVSDIGFTLDKISWISFKRKDLTT